MNREWYEQLYRAEGSLMLYENASMESVGPEMTYGNFRPSPTVISILPGMGKETFL